MESNGFFQIVLNKAAHFWNNRDRSVALNADGSVMFEDVKDTAEKTTCPASAGGDAAGMALYRSTDGGHSFAFVKIQN